MLVIETMRNNIYPISFSSITSRTFDELLLGVYIKHTWQLSHTIDAHVFKLTIPKSDISVLEHLLF